MEKLIYQRLYLFLEHNNIIYHNQFGFRYNHSKEHALTAHNQEIQDACDKSALACGVFLDFRIAFDSVNHDILFSKLEYYGVRNISKDWFSSYLNNRTQFVTINTERSLNTLVSHGVPQESVLGSLLFLLFINDLHKTITNGTLRHFADDTNLLIVSKSVKKINREVNYNLRLISDWLKKTNSVLIQVKQIITFKAKTKKITKHLNFRLSGQKIHIKNNVKYLGITVQDDLGWETHVNNLLKKLRRSVAILSKVRHYTPKWLTRTIYYSLFNSHMIYGCQIWGQHKTSLVNRVMKLQEKAIRIINFKDNNAQVSNIFAQSNILKFEDFVHYRNINLVKNSTEKHQRCIK